MEKETTRIRRRLVQFYIVRFLDRAMRPFLEWIYYSEPANSLFLWTILYKTELQLSFMLAEV